MKKAARYTGRVLLGIVAFLVLYVIAALGIQRITVNREKDAGNDIAIYIKTNGVHTDIVMPVRSEFADWSKDVQYAFTGLTDTTYPYLAVGWGDKGFYLETPEWSDLKFSVAFKAASGLGTTAIHATFYKEMTENESCRKMYISKDQYKRLISFVRQSFATDAENHFMNIKTKANYGISDAFYEARGHYSLFYTCNTWANQALKSCGQKCCLWTVLDKGIFAKYK